MCTYQSELVTINASGKAPSGWRRMATAQVYVDHPVDFPAGHAVMIDVLDAQRDPSSRVALEMDAASARALADALLRALESAPPGLLD
jgi:hypothetical protein